jgi:hypothetical protein
MKQIYFINLFNLFIGGTIIYYLNHLEKIGCKCSLTFQRNYIYYYTISFFIINLLNIFFYNIFILPIQIILLLAGIINIVYTIEYVEDMKKQNCKCSESMIRDLMFIIAILKIFVYIIFIFIILSIFLFKMNSKLNLRKLKK